MELNLHANTMTTPKVKAYVQRSKQPVADLAAELGVRETTIRRGRTTARDNSHTLKTVQPRFSPMEETLIRELRTKLLQLPRHGVHHRSAWTAGAAGGDENHWHCATRVLN
jgi:hypothetical protein